MTPAHIFSPFFLMVLFFGLNLSAQTSVGNTDPLKIEARIEPYSLSPGQSAEVILNLRLPNEYHAYADQFKFIVKEPEALKHGQFKIAPVIEFFDKFSKKKRTGIQDQASMRISFDAPAMPEVPARIVLELTYQACSDSFCLFPKKRQITIPFRWAAAAAAEKNATPADGPATPLWSGESVKKALAENLLLAFVLVFFSGILTSFTPCIFPMIPITLAILGHDAENRSRRQNFFLSVFYVHGIATTYSILGLIAASSGQLFGSNLGHPAVLGVMCAIFFLMALSMYGVFELQIPGFLRQQLAGHKSGASYLGAYLSGIVAGIVASPCVGPVLVTLLAFVASTQDRLLGFFLLFTYAIGLGVIFLILGAFTELVRRLPRSGPWMVGMKFLLGSLMLGAFFYYLSFLLPLRWHDGALGLALIMVASFFGAFANVAKAGKFQRIRKGLMQGTLVVGIAFAVMAVFDLRSALQGPLDGPHELEKAELSKWKPYSEGLLQEARAAGRPVIIDFYADWCLACHELDQHTFSNPDVKEALKNHTLLRFDATKDSAELNQLKTEYEIMGLPTVVFVNSKGEWVRSETLTQFEKPEAFLRRVQRLNSQN